MKKNPTDEELEREYRRRESFFSKRLSGNRQHEMLFEPYNVSPTEYRALAFLLFCPGGSEPSVIADTLCILRQTMTKVVDSLERKGLVTRTGHPSDRRRVSVVLEPKGEALARELLILETRYQESVDARLTPEELETYHRLFWRIQEIRQEELDRILSSRKK